MKQRQWPERYKVTVHNISGGTANYYVTTWLAENKAIALAAIEHENKYHKGLLMPLYDVSVEDLGPAPKNSNGLAEMPESDLGDRNEW